MRQVLITAGAGLIGAAISERLVAAGHSVVVLDARPLPLGLRPTRYVAARVTDPRAVEEAVEGCTDIVHLEWSGGVREATQVPYEKHEHAVTASLRLLEIARKRQLGFLFSSTSPYRGDAPASLPETAPVSERSIYAIQKRYVESLLTAYSANFGLRGASLRIFNAYGPGGRPGQILNQIRRALSEGSSITLNGDGGQVRDFIHIDDVTSAFLRALEAPDLTGETINIGTGIGTSMLELVHLVERITGGTVPVIHAPAKGEESRYLVADIERARDRLNWRPKIALEEGLRRTLLGEPK